MGHGPGKYDDLCTQARNTAKAAGVVLIVFGGEKGDGFSVQASAQTTGDGRVVNVVSMLHTRATNAMLFTPLQPYNSWTAYGRSKLALVHATFEMQRCYAQASKVQAYCLHPGAVFTRIADRGLAGNPLVESLRRAMSPVEALFLLTPEEGAQTQIHCATQPGLAGGRYYEKCQPVAPSPQVQDVQISTRLCDETEAWVRSLD